MQLSQFLLVGTLQAGITSNYIFLFAMQQKPRILNTQKQVINQIIDFRGQNEIKYNKLPSFYYSG